MKISEVSKKYNISQDTLRYYERIGLIPKVNREANGIRDYQEEDIKWIEFILCMRRAGMVIETLIDYVQLFQLGDSTIKARKLIIIDQKAQIDEKIKEYEKISEKLNYKITNYEEKLLEIEKSLSQNIKN